VQVRIGAHASSLAQACSFVSRNVDEANAKKVRSLASPTFHRAAHGFR
jgi:hypothetical protein